MSSGVPVFVKLILMIGASLLLAGLVSGVVLIVVGAAKKRRGVLIGGIVVLALTGAVMAVMGVLAGLMFYAVLAPSSPAPLPARVAVSEADAPFALAPEDLAEAVALDDPFGLRGVAANPPELRFISHGGDSRLFHGAARVGADFETALQWHFQKTTWAETRQAAAGHGSFDPAKLWAGAGLEGLPCYRRSFEADGQPYVAYVCYDSKTRRAYLFRMRAP